MRTDFHIPSLFTRVRGIFIHFLIFFVFHRFVEMLESHHALVVKALQQLYAHCIKNKCFPGEPIDVVDGFPLTHAILDRMGLIKQAEETAKLGDDSEQFQYWKSRTMSVTSNDTDDLSSSEKTCSLELSPSSEGAISDIEAVKTEPSFVCPSSPYETYNYGERLWPVEESTSTQPMEFNNAFPAATFNLDEGCLASSDVSSRPNIAPPSQYGPLAGDRRVPGPGHSYQLVNNTSSYVSHGIPYNGSSHVQTGMEQHTWTPGVWTR